MNTMTTEEILKAYEAQESEEQALIEQKNAKIRAIAESRQKAEARKAKIEEIKKKILEKREAVKEGKKPLKEEEEPKFEVEGDDEEVFDVEEDVEEEPEAEEEVEDEEEVEEVEDEEEVQKESKQAILKKIAERKRQDILKKIAERKAVAEAESKKEKVEEKKEVRVGTLLEAAEGDKKRRFSVYREEKNHFYLKELGSGKTYKIAKEKVELV